MHKKILAIPFALLLAASCDDQKTFDNTASEAPPITTPEARAERADRIERSETMTALKDQMNEFRMSTKRSLSDLDNRLQKADKRVDKSASRAKEDVKEHAEQLEQDSERVFADIKTRLDRLGNDIDSLGAQTDDDLQKAKKDIDQRMKELDRDIAKLIEGDDNKGVDDGS